MTTPQQVSLTQQGMTSPKDRNGKGWMSFEESPVHGVTTDTKLPSCNEEGWTTFSDTSCDPGASTLTLKSGDSHLVSASHMGPNYPRSAVGPPSQKKIHQSSHHSKQVVSVPNLPPGLLQSPAQSALSTQMSSSHMVPSTRFAHLSTYSQPQGAGTTSLNKTAISQAAGTPLHHITKLDPLASQAHIPFDRQGAVCNTSFVTQNAAHLNTTNIDHTHQGRSAPEEGHQHLQRLQSVDDHYSKMNDSNGHDPWRVTEEQRAYYTNQFATMQPSLSGKIDGQTARNFFTKSRLPIPELSHIWELCDMDQDGNLTLDEFCAAFHLVVARKNGYDLPPLLPQSLVPSLIDIGSTGGEASSEGAVMQKVSNSAGMVQTDNNKTVSGLTGYENEPPFKFQSKSGHDNESPQGHQLAIPQPHSKVTGHQQLHQEKWETFSDRTSSSTTLANFEQDLGNTENLIHPIAMRMTPSKHEAHSARIRSNKSPAKSTDEGDSSPPLAARVPVPHRSLTNPYGSLTNDLSEPDNSEKSKLSAERRRVPSTSSSSSSSAISPVLTAALNTENTKWFQRTHEEVVRSTSLDNDKFNKTTSSEGISSKNLDLVEQKKNQYQKNITVRKGLRSRSSSGSSHSSIATSDRSSEIDANFHPPASNHSDQECSDWSSRPLRPRSCSDSSMESPSLRSNVLAGPPSNVAPTPPPRPNQQVPLSKKASVEKNAVTSNNPGSAHPDTSGSAPTPPPRPQMSTAIIQHEAFADFSQFDQQVAEEPPASAVTSTPPAGLNEKEGDKPVPAPRHARDEKSSKESSEPESREEKTPDKLVHKKAPTKPPRSRILSTDSARHDRQAQHTSVKLMVSEDGLDVPQKPSQVERPKVVLQQSIRDLKLSNSQLTRLNAELQQQLKDVMQSRITVEMSIHQLRPFSQ